jgi:hypothetical protein
MPHELFVTKLVVAKICHDLATPLNALSLGLEMSEDASFSKDTIDLIQQSAETMKSRLKLFRSLWSASPNAPTFQEAREILTECALKSKVEIHWALSPHMVESPVSSSLRLLLGLGFMALEGLPRGGTVTVSLSNEGDISIAAEGTIAQLRPGYEEVLLSDQRLEDQTSRTILPFYIRLLSHVCGKSVSYKSQSTGSFEILATTASPPS